MKVTVKERLVADLTRKVTARKEHFDKKVKELEENRKNGRCDEKNYQVGRRQLREYQASITAMEAELNALQK